MTGAPDAPLLVLGLGNLLCGDDGVGIRAVRALAEGWTPPSTLRVLDGGTLGLSLLGWFEAGQDVLLVDAIRAEAPPGTLVRLEGSEVAPAVRDRLSVHQIGVADLLDGLRLIGAWPRRLDLIGVVPEQLELGLDLSPRVESGLGALVDALVAEIGSRGHILVPRTFRETRVDGDDHAARALGL